MTSISGFDPQSLDLDIYVQSVKGLGRGRGFKVVGKQSALYKSSVTQRIKDRLLDLAEMLSDVDILSEAELCERFDLHSYDEIDTLNERVEAKDRTIKKLRDEAESTAADREDLDDELDSMVSDISDALGYNWYDKDNYDDDKLDILKSGIESLIEEYSALKAEKEEES